MGKVVVFGAGGRAGRAAVAEARRRGHHVTAVVRDPARYGELVEDGVDLVGGDVTSADSVAVTAAGADAAISAVYDPVAQPDEFFAGAARALVGGLGRTDVGRLVVVGLASILETPAGPPLMDTPGYPQEYRFFYLAHAAGIEVLRAAGTSIDWLAISPAGDFDHVGARTGRYRTALADATSRISYTDFAIALLDETDNPRHHRTHIGVERS